MAKKRANRRPPSGTPQPGSGARGSSRGAASGSKTGKPSNGKGSAGKPSAAKGRPGGKGSVGAKNATAGKRKTAKGAGKPRSSANTGHGSKPIPVVKRRAGTVASRPRRKPTPVAESTNVTLPPRERGERLHKVLAAAGIASRRECESLILEGRVEVDGKVVTDQGVRVDPFKSKIFFDGEALPRPRRVYFAVNKPDGIVSTSSDPSGRPRVTDLLPPDVGRVFAVGRLDMSSEGLILVTNDGELANGLTHPRHGVQKTYHVQVAGVPSAETLGQLRQGVYLSDGHAHFVDAKLKRRRKQGAILEVVLDEGRNREIRRLLARVGHKVQKLTRIAVGPVRLGEMEPGSYRPLTPEEITALRRAIAAPAVVADAPSEESAPGAARPARQGKRDASFGKQAKRRPATGGRPVKGSRAAKGSRTVGKPAAASKSRSTSRSTQRPDAKPAQSASVDTRSGRTVLGSDEPVSEPAKPPRKKPASTKTTRRPKPRGPSSRGKRS
ncbi:pseudouridine synthase [Botrimarina hoheduenensis]|uniref:Pseudouridine synthase n=1 Tax=Botrimarina hoheduenensis TaxID=2528000 RepID=A0A5C5VTD3_9BACT|nr:pseudouridine synthase [Botrimarina hoheduenensis]TWT41580.1 Ribosomal large subunit pseudouridine synthase B [Botrimarina hoheduenensis]